MILEALTQLELQKEDASLQGSGCRKMWNLSLRPGKIHLLAYRRSAAVEELCCHVKELQVEVSRLCNIREDEKEINQFFSETLLLPEPKSPTVTEESVPVRLETGNSFDGKGWKLVNSDTRRKAPVTD